MLNQEFLIRKIKLIQEDLSHLEPVSKFSFNDIVSDPIKQSAVERYLERIVTRAIDINRHLIAEFGQGNEITRSYEDTFLRLADLKVLSNELAQKIAPSAGLRNVLVHEYDEVDPKLVYESIGEAINQYGEYCAAILKFVDQKAD